MTSRLKPDKAIVRDVLASAVWATEVEVFLRRRTDMAMMELGPAAEGFAVAIRFKTAIEAEQFHKLLMRRGRVRK